MQDTNDYNKKYFQEYLIRFMLSDDTSFVRVQSIIEDTYFLDNLRPIVRSIKEHADTYNKVPTPEQLKAMTGYDTELLPVITQEDVDHFLNSTESFCRHRALENIIHSGPDLLMGGKGGDLERQIKEAMTISLVTDIGVSFFEEVRERIEARRDRSNYVSTGWKSLDYKLGGGFTRGSLNIFAGGSGSGKSIFLQNIALNWSLAGFNVVYISLELSESLVNERLEAMTTSFKTSELLRNIDNVVFKIAKIKKGSQQIPKAGDLRVKKFPEAGTSANTIKAYLKEYQIKTGKRPDVLIVDYLDLMHPNNAKIDVSNLFTKDKYVSEELRSIGGEWDIPVVSASQLNRQSVDALEFDHSHIAGGISKINTADNVFGIFTSMTMRQNGFYEIQFLKTRSAAATGQKLKLSYDVDCMRLKDLEDQPDDPPNNKAQSSAAINTSQSSSTSPLSISPVASQSADFRSQIDNLMDITRKSLPEEDDEG